MPRSLLFLLIFFSLGFLIACNSDSDPEDEPSADLPEGFQQYEHEDLGFFLLYPENWSVHKDTYRDDSVTFGSPEEGYEVELAVLDMGPFLDAYEEDPVAYMENVLFLSIPEEPLYIAASLDMTQTGLIYIDSGLELSDDVKVIEERELVGEPTVEYVIEGTNSSGGELRLHFLYSVIEDQLYAFQFVAYKEEYEANLETFYEMVKSFKLDY